VSGQKHALGNFIGNEATTRRVWLMRALVSALLIGLGAVAPGPAGASTPNAGRLAAEAFAWADKHASVELSASLLTSPQQSITMLLTPLASQTTVTIAGTGTSSVIRETKGHVTYVNVSSLAELASLQVSTASPADENVWFTVSSTDPRNQSLTTWQPLTVRSVFSYGLMGFRRPMRFDGVVTLDGVRVYRLITMSYTVDALGPPGPTFLYLTDTTVPRPFAGRAGTGANVHTMYFTHWDNVSAIDVPTRAAPLPQ
jgi:hypothetical protein